MIKILNPMRQIRSMNRSCLRYTPVFSFADEGQQPPKVSPYMNKNKNAVSSRDVQIQEKYHVKSAKLYDRYLKSREKPYLTLDNYQIHYGLIICRMPIFYPYQKRSFEAYKNKYQFDKKTGYFIPYGKDLLIEKMPFQFGQFVRNNPENLISHVTYEGDERRDLYCEKSRFWRMTDPQITDHKSVQNHSSDFVYFIVKDKSGKWKFPSRPITQLETHDEFFENFQKQIFAASSNPTSYYEDRKPILAIKKKEQNVERGQGILTLFYKGTNIRGMAQYPTNIFDDYAWVPKPHLAKYFDDQYYSQVIRSVYHNF